MQKRQILINATMSVTQICVISSVIFVLYRFLLGTIGAGQLGIWSLVISTTSVTQIANIGLSGSVVKFVAKYIARGEDGNVSSVIQTATLSVAAFLGLILISVYPIVKWVLGLVISDESISLAFSVLPYAFLALWSMAITGIFQGGLDGCQRIDVRGLLLMGGAILHLLVCFVLAPIYGLIGLAYARVLINLLILTASWILLKRALPVLPIFPHIWEKGLFREMFGYAINFQVTSVAQMLYDPITKALLSRFGGLSEVGYYEMASRMILQFRALIVSANQVLVPAIANLMEKAPEKLESVYLSSYQLVFYLAIPLYSLIVICIPIISDLWIGHYEDVFVHFGILLAFGWLLNTLNSPAYFSYLAIGELRWNVISHITIGLLNAGLGFLLGVLYDGIGVVVAWVISLALGSSIVYLSYHIKYKIPFIELLPKSSRLITIVCLVAILSALIMQQNHINNINVVPLNIIIICSFSIICFFPFWFHPMRKRLAEWVASELLKRAQKKS